MFIDTKSKSIRFTGRWYETEEGVTTTAPGSIIELAYKGEMAVLWFDLITNRQPYGHLWISVDNGTRVEVPLCEYIRVDAKDEGEHTVQIIYKSASEIHHRWYQPLEGKVTFLGFEADDGAELAPDNRKIIEFVGDSITEGVAIDSDYKPDKFWQWNRPYQDDAAATYAFLTAEKLNLRPIITGYGSVGITKSGLGGVPKATDSYPYCFENAPYKSVADYIVINYGANDANSDKEEYISGYIDLLNFIRSKNDKAKIIVLSAFCGAFHDDLQAAIEKLNDNTKDCIYFISTKGWAIEEKLHPSREGHIALARKLTEELKNLL